MTVSSKKEAVQTETNIAPVAEGSSENGLAVQGASCATRADVKRVARALRRGEVAVFPTDTVAGVGVSISAAPTPAPLFSLKHRPADKPIAWLVGSSSALDVYGVAVPGYARQIALAWWPGPITLIVHASPAVPSAYRPAGQTIALRMPDCRDTLDLIERVGCPLATTSANFAGSPAPRSVAQVNPVFSAAVDAILPDGEAAESGVASTIVDCTAPTPRIVREGAITAEDIEQLLERVGL